MWILLNYKILSYLNYLINIILILMSVAFLTLLERKVLGYIQNRKGPNKLGYMGIIQPFSDAIKLMSKENLKLKMINYLYYFFSPILMMAVSMFIWIFLLNLNNNFSVKLNLFMILCCLSISMYCLMIVGWSSNSMYSLLGSIRSIAQAVSYEVSLIFLLVIMFMMIESLMMKNFLLLQSFYFFFYMMPILLIMFISILAELNRSPFDLVEGESELVSGFNVEYYSGGFVLLFLSEYMNIIFMSYLIMMIFMNFFNEIFNILILIIILMLILLIRGVTPRLRYDELMMMCWLKILPLVMNYLIFVYSLKFYLI